MRKASTLTIKPTETPYLSLKKDSNKNHRNNLLASYYDQYGKPDKLNKNMTIEARSGSRRGINSLIGDLVKNQNALESQNLELKILRDQVSNFMQQTHQPAFMAKSGSQPNLTANALIQLDEEDDEEFHTSKESTFNKLPSLNASRSSRSRTEL